MTAEKTFNLADLLDIVVDTVPAEREALVCGGRRLSYREFRDNAQRLALWLRSRGIGTNDTVGIQAANSIEFLEATFAAYMLRAVPVNVNYRYTADEARYIYTDAELKALFYDRALEDAVGGALDGAPGLRALVRIGSGAPSLPSAVAYATAAIGATGTLADIERSDDDLLLLYTGGTTGMPKGVMWTHKALFYAAFGGGGSLHPAGAIANPAELATRVRETYPLHQLPCGPLMHGAGMWATTIGLLAGCTVYLNDRPAFDAEYILGLIHDEKISCLNVVGDAMVLPLLEALQREPQRWDLRSVVAVSNGGAMLSEHAREALRPYLAPNVHIVDSLGSSETGTSGGGGKPDDGGLLRIPPSPTVAVAVDGKRFAKPGEMGILVRMGHLPLGYFRDPEKTASTFVIIDGRRCAISGDAARLETDASITVFGRDSQCINTGGEKVFTEEVEEGLRSYPGVRDAVVVGVPDPRWGQKVVALVSLRRDVAEDTDALKQHCRARLAGYKVPKDVLFVAEVARNPMGKADYRWARQVAERRLGSEPVS